ncbi:MAG: CPBP family intramembrane metalloprotease [Rubrivivax sp.]|nr:CPBP family intramembrane metalloprotease [Rubrivivax sp.]
MIAGVLVMAMVEEFVFRGLVLRYLLTVLGTNAAVWLVSMGFAVVHFNLAGIPFYAIAGAALGYIAVVAGSWIWPALIHAAVNLLITARSASGASELIFDIWTNKIIGGIFAVMMVLVLMETVVNRRNSLPGS